MSALLAVSKTFITSIAATAATATTLLDI